MFLRDRFLNALTNEFTWLIVCGNSWLRTLAVFSFILDRPTLLVANDIPKIHDHGADLSFGRCFNLLYTFLEPVEESLPGRAIDCLAGKAPALPINRCQHIGVIPLGREGMVKNDFIAQVKQCQCK